MGIVTCVYTHTDRFNRRGMMWHKGSFPSGKKAPHSKGIGAGNADAAQ